MSKKNKVSSSTVFLTAATLSLSMAGIAHAVDTKEAIKTKTSKAQVAQKPKLVGNVSTAHHPGSIQQAVGTGHANAPASGAVGPNGAVASGACDETSDTGMTGCPG